MSSKVSRLTIALAVLVCGALSAQEDQNTAGVNAPATKASYHLEQMVFLPPVYYVGDVVECRLRISTDGVELPNSPERLPDASWVDIREVTVIPIADRYDIRIRFASFRPGVLEIPSIRIGAVTLDPIRIETSSIRQEDNPDFHGVFDPLLLPGTKLFIGVAAGVVIFGPLLLLLLAGWLRRTMSDLAGNLRARRPYRKLSRRLETLHEAATRTSAREFYQALFDSFRSYLTDRSDRNFEATTTTEMGLLAREVFEEVKPLEALSEMVPAIDRAKYGGAESSQAEKLKGLELVRAAADEIERRHRDRSAQ